MIGVLAKNRVFGGQAVAQAFRAIQEHLGKNIIPATLHYRFIAPATGDFPLDYKVSQIDSTVLVEVRQERKFIGSAHIRISDDQFPSYPLELDYVDPPEDLPQIEELIETTEIDIPIRAEVLEDIIYEIRPVEFGRYSVKEKSTAIHWMRIQRDSIESIPLWCGLQSILFLSDFLIIQPAEDIYWKNGYIMATGASLTHSVRFHKPNCQINPHDWFLSRLECESSGMNRCKLIQKIYNRKKQAVATVIQEAFTQPIARL